MRVMMLSVIPFLTLATPAASQVPGLSDLVGARAAGAEQEMLRRGYVNTGGSQGDDRTYTNWWNARSRICVTVATMNGRYASITPTTAPDCRAQAATLPSGPLRPRPVVPIRPVQSWTHAEVDLGLVCYGEGGRPVAASRQGYAWDAEKDRYVFGNRTELRQQEFDATVMIQLWEGGGRIKLPTRLVPPIHSRDDNGWWTLSNVVQAPGSIRASYRLNGLNKPNVSIDRRSGRISIRGTAGYTFNGTCDAIGAEAHPRF